MLLKERERKSKKKVLQEKQLVLARWQRGIDLFV
jgi:hypothetical protein